MLFEPTQVTVHPDPPVLKASGTTELEVRHRPLVVGAWEGSLKLESAELGLYEWGLKLAGAPVAPERGLVFTASLGGRDVQVRRQWALTPAIVLVCNSSGRRQAVGVW